MTGHPKTDDETYPFWENPTRLYEIYIRQGHFVMMEPKNMIEIFRGMIRHFEGVQRNRIDEAITLLKTGGVTEAMKLEHIERIKETA